MNGRYRPGRLALQTDQSVEIPFRQGDLHTGARAGDSSDGRVVGESGETGERVPESARLSPWSSFLWFDVFLSLYMFQCLPFVSCQVVGLFTLDDVLGLVS